MNTLRTFGLMLALGCTALVSPLQAGLPRNEVGVQVTVAGKGSFVIQLFPKQAPLTVARVQALAGEGFYDGQRFFKVVRSPRPFLVQFGDPTSRTKAMDDPSLGTARTGARIAYENSGLKHVRGAVGFARLSEDRNTGDSQMYIMLDSAPFLDGQYTVFGMVVSGMDVVDSIALGDRIERVSQVTGR